MKNTSTLALSLTAIKQEITAQCAWIDATNLTILPPIVNPTKRTDIDFVIYSNLSSICNRLSGYIISSTQNDDIYNIEMRTVHLSEEKRTSLLRHISECAIHGIIAELYSSQQQASHICAMFLTKRDSSMRRILQLLAYTN